MQQTIQTSQLSDAEICRLGQAIYDRDLKPHLEPVHDGKFVVIHVANGDHVVDADEDKALDAALEKYPEDVFFIVRIGAPSTVEFRSPR